MNPEKWILGMELGSTRIKAVLIDEAYKPVAQGSFEWENKLENGIWTYSMDLVHRGVQACYADLKKNVKETYGVTLKKVAAMGVSAMMHGYLPFDKNGKQLAEFRTWRNTITGEAAEKLTAMFDFNIPQRWSIAHLYQAMLNGEEHVSRIASITTLAGYIHRRLTGLDVMGVGEASGMFPVVLKEDGTAAFDAGMLDKFEAIVKEMGYTWSIRQILPKVVKAGEFAGCLTEEGARFLDPEGDLEAGIPLAPCEGDAGTGMAATNSVRVHTGNVSAGTSDFAMLVTDRKLGVHREIDMVTTPSGLPVAMVHCNNCTSEINAWVELFSEFAKLIGAEKDKGTLFTLLFKKALEGDPDCGGLLSYNYFSGEGVTDLDEGRPLFMRRPDASFTLANFMRMHLLSALSTLKIGLDILTKEEGLEVEKIYGHGGFFKTPVVGQRMLSAAIGAPVSVMETAGEGGPYGMALLGAYLVHKEEAETLEDYLDNKVFAEASVSSVMAEPSDIEGFAAYLEQYVKSLQTERSAVETMR